MDQHLNIFVTVVEKQNFSRAAEALHMTQPAVSQYIRTFEQTIGVRLLERTNKYVRLNKAGEIVYHHAKEIVHLYDRMQHLVDDLTNEASGTLSIGASYTFGEYVLPRILAKLLTGHPAIDPAVTIGNTAEIARLVLNHELDVGIVEGHHKDSGQLQNEEFAEDEMVIVAAAHHPLFDQSNPVTLQDVAAQTWILREEGSGTREAAETFFKRFCITPSKTLYFSSTQPIKEAIVAGLGVTLLSHWAIQRECKTGELRMVPIDGLPFKRQFSIITRSSFQTKALQVFLDALHDKELTSLQ